MSLENKTRINRRTFLKTTFAAGALMALSGCSISRPVQSAASKGGILTWALPTPLSIDPAYATDEQAYQVINQVFSPLLTYDYHKKALVGCAAESWDVNDTQDEYIFHLHKKAAFHNGDEVRSQSFKYAWEFLARGSKQFPHSPHRYLLRLIEGYQAFIEGKSDHIEGITCPDDITLMIKLTEPSAEFPSIVTHLALVPRPDQHPEINMGKELIGNGPFYLKDPWDGYSDIDLVRFDNYFDNPALVDGVRFVLHTSAPEAFDAVKSGRVDLAHIPYGSYHDASIALGLSTDGYTIEPGKQCIFGDKPAVSYICCNTEDPVLKHTKLRQALSLALDRQGISEELYNGSKLAADNIIPPLIDGYEKGAWQYAYFDEPLSRELLDTALKELKLDELKLELIYSEESLDKPLVEALKDDFAEMGIAIELNELAPDVMMKRLKDRDFQLAHLTWTADYPSMDNFLYPLFYKNLQFNYSGYTNDEVCDKLDEARTLTDSSKAQGIFKTANKTISQDTPVIPLLFEKLSLAGSKSIKFARINPDGLCNIKEVELN